MRDSLRALREGGIHVVVGTPGRVMHMIRERELRPETIRTFVLDEADEMLSKGFKDQIYEIFQSLQPDIQTVLVRSVHCACCFTREEPPQSCLLIFHARRSSFPFSSVPPCPTTLWL